MITWRMRLPTTRIELVVAARWFRRALDHCGDAEAAVPRVNPITATVIYIAQTETDAASDRKARAAMNVQAAISGSRPNALTIRP
jgi:hypothetical protein